VVDASGAATNATLTFNISGVANTFTGTAGNDTLIGTRGDDTLIGKDGNDVLIGGAGADTLIGGDGIDTASYANATAGVRAYMGIPPWTNSGDAAGDTYCGIENLTGSAFDDSLVGDNNANVLDGGAGMDALIGGGGNDVLIGGAGGDFLAGDDGIDTASFATARMGVVANLGTKTGTVGDAAGDRYEGIENLTGSAFDDMLTGDDGMNVLDGGAGDDTLVGGLGPDLLIGGDGRDMASYATANHAVVANLTASYLNGGDAAGDRYDGIENLKGSAYDDKLTGDYKDNVLDGGAGNDVLVDGGGGNDVFIGGVGIDTVSYAASAGAVIANLLAPSLNGGVAAGDFYSTVENLTGTAFADQLTGDAGDNVLDGGAGDDALNGGSGNDILIGGAGKDSLNGGAGIDTASYATATAGVTASLTPGPGPGFNGTGDAAGDMFVSIENITGSAYDDKLTGSSLANVIEGGGGNDWLTGGGGNDTFVFHAGFGQDKITDFTEGAGAGDVIQVDRALFADFAAVTSHAVQIGTDLVIKDNAGDTITLSNTTVAGLAPDDFLFV
jgi:Ca2+-binding RTX toxin-like protein